MKPEGADVSRRRFLGLIGAGAIAPTVLAAALKIKESTLVKRGWQDLIKHVPNAMYHQLNSLNPYNISDNIGRSIKTLHGAWLNRVGGVGGSAFIVEREIWIWNANDPRSPHADGLRYPVFFCRHGGANIPGPGRCGEFTDWKDIKQAFEISYRKMLRKGLRPRGHDHHIVEWNA